MSKSKHQRPRAKKAPSSARPDVGTLLRENPKLIKVLHEYGIHFCAGCYLTLSATPEKAAAYHGVPDIPRFVMDLKRAIAAKPHHKHSHHH